MAQLHLKIVTPEQEIFDDEVNEVVVPSSEGELGILPHHMNLMAKVVPGELHIHKDGKIDVLATGSGFLQVSDNTLTIMTDLALNAKELDAEAIQEAKKRAESALEQVASDEAYADALAALEKLLVQEKILRRHHTR